MPGKGAYWKKGGLIDETVKEEDLSQALQAKVNAVGGGGDVVLLESLDFTGSTNSLLWTFSQSYPFQYNSGLYQKFRVEANIMSSGQGDLGYRPNDIPNVVNYDNSLQQNGLSFGTGVTDRISLVESGGGTGGGAFLSFDFMKQPDSFGFFMNAVIYHYRNNAGASGGGHFKDNIPNGNNSIGDSISSLRFLNGGGETIETGTTLRLYGIKA